MVGLNKQTRAATLQFQYSLCRVVLMVDCPVSVIASLCDVSVLALSSRFDGRLPYH